eukprot:10814144-Ditylum_brightwellii.AAC.2
MEWILPGTAKIFNLRTALVVLLEKYHNIDTTVYCRSSIDRKNWKNTNYIPSRKELTKSMDVKEEVNQRNKFKVKAYVTIISHLQLNTLKFKLTVYNHLNTHNLYIKADLFMQNDVISIGKITYAHPKMVHREDYATEINRYTFGTVPLNNTAVHQ